jgi:hypothetical protein
VRNGCWWKRWWMDGASGGVAMWLSPAGAWACSTDIATGRFVIHGPRATRSSSFSPWCWTRPSARTGCRVRTRERRPREDTGRHGCDATDRCDVRGSPPSCRQTQGDELQKRR